MKKKLTIVVMVVLAAILIASPVLAAGSSHSMEVAKQGPKKKPTVISMTGTIMSISGTQIKVKIQMTNKAFIKYRGTTQWVRTTTSTRYILWDGQTRAYIKFRNLAIGDKVSINAKVRSGVFVARRVQVRQPRYP